MKKIIIKHTFLIFLIILVSIFESDYCYSRISTGQMSPVFSLKDMNGKTFNLSYIKEQPMITLYFFDVESRPSQEGLLSLNRLAKKYEKSDLIVWAITLSEKVPLPLLYNLTFDPTLIVSSAIT